MSEVRAFGRRADPLHDEERPELDRFEPKTRIEISCVGSKLSAIVETILEIARTGQRGDGKILIGTLAWAYQIRTGAEGNVALYHE